MIRIEKCTICKEELKDIGLKVKDRLVSGEEFVLYSCMQCGLIHTSPIPDKNELSKYYKSEGYISHTEKPKNAFEQTYFFIRNKMIRKKIGFIKKYVKKTPSILDFGCGTGSFLAKCVEKGWIGYGFEPEKAARETARKITKAPVKENLDQLNKYKSNPFDVISLWHVIEHVYELDETMSCFNEVLKDGGLLVIAVPDHESYDACFYREKWAGYDTPRHLYHFNENAIKALGIKYGFKLIGKKPLIFDSFFVSLLSENEKKNVLKHLRAAIVGLISNIYGLLKIKPYSSQVYFLKKERNS